MSGKFNASMEVIDVSPVDGSDTMFRVWARTKDSTLMYDTPWPPSVGEFLIVGATVQP